VGERKLERNRRNKNKEERKGDRMIGGQALGISEKVARKGENGWWFSPQKTSGKTSRAY